MRDYIDLNSQRYESEHRAGKGNRRFTRITISPTCMRTFAITRNWRLLLCWRPQTYSRGKSAQWDFGERADSATGGRPVAVGPRKAFSWWLHQSLSGHEFRSRRVASFPAHKRSRVQTRTIPWKKEELARL